MLVMLLLSASCFSGVDTGIELDPLRRIVDGLQGDLKDVEFSYEGGETNIMERNAGRPLESTFQGRFAYRADDSAHIDLFIDYPEPERPIERRVYSLIRGSNPEEVRYRPDMRGLTSADTRKKPGGILALIDARSPLRYWPMPMLLGLLRDEGGYRTNNKFQYSCLGWEDVDGHRCLRVRFRSEYQGKPSEQYDFWLDMGRGGIPIRFELNRRGIFWARTELDQLGQFPIPGGRQMWFPIHGLHRTYIQGERSAEGIVIKSTDRPVLEETFVVINGSVALNRSLPDERFTIGWTPRPQDDLLKAKRIEHESLVGRRSKAIDLARAKVERTVVEAERQGRLLQASAPSREWSASTMVGAFAIGLLGLALISSPLIVRRWNR